MVEELEMRLDAIARGEVFDEPEPKKDNKKKQEKPSFEHTIKSYNKSSNRKSTIVETTKTEIKAG